MLGVHGESLDAVLEKFKLDTDGRLKNERLEKVRAGQVEYREKQSKIAKTGWEKRRVANANPMPTHMPDGCQNDALQSSSSTSSLSTTITSTSDILLGKESKSDYEKTKKENSEMGLGEVQSDNDPNGSPLLERTDLTAKTEKPKEKSSAKKEKVSEDETELTPFEMFQSIHQAWPANKRTAKTDWVDFEKKYKKEFTAEFFRAIYRGIQNKIKYHRHLQSINAKFIPEWPHLKTYLNQRRWEEQTDLTIPIQTNGQQTFNSQRQQSNGAGADLETAVAMSRLVVSDGYKQAG